MIKIMSLLGERYLVSPHIYTTYTVHNSFESGAGGKWMLYIKSEGGGTEVYNIVMFIK